METSDINPYQSNFTNDALHLITIRLKTDYENSRKKTMKCDIHRLNQMTSYCRQCREKVCLDCETKHEKHDLTDSNRVVMEKIDIISKIIEKFYCIKSDINEVILRCDKQRNTIYKNQETSLNNIEEVFENLHRELDRLKNELLLELHQVVENCLTRLNGNKVELAALHDDVSTITELVLRQDSAFQYHDLFELEEYTNQKLIHYCNTLPLDPLRPNELNIQVKWTDNMKNMIRQPLAKINCHISPEKLSFLQAVSIEQNDDKRKPFISSICCDRNNVIYLCDTENNKIKIVNSDFSMKKSFTGTGKYKLVSPTTILSLQAQEKSPSKLGNLSATVVVSDPGSKNIVTFNENGNGIDTFVTNGSSASMSSINNVNELENLQESSLELSPIYTSMDGGESQELHENEHAIIVCTKSENLNLEFLQINPTTKKLCKSRPDLMLSSLGFVDNSFVSKCIAWNPVSKFLFLLNNEEHKILIFSGQDGRFVRFYGRYGDGHGEFNQPTSIVVDDKGFVLISDMVNNRIHVLDSLGNFVKFLFPYSHKYPIFQPTAMCFDNGNNLLICEKGGKLKIYTYN